MPFAGMDCRPPWRAGRVGANGRPGGAERGLEAIGGAGGSPAILGATAAVAPAAITCKTCHRSFTQLSQPSNPDTAMPHLMTDDNVELYYEETGSGTPI